jgi:pyrimidine deaminase RibD-like protein
MEQMMKKISDKKMQRFLHRAARAAHLSTNKHYMLGAVLIKGGKVVESGCNTSSTFSHAEAQVLRKYKGAV